MPSAAACVPMCQPSASSAIEPKIEPATISATIITTVRITTNQVRRSFCACFAPRKTWSCLQRSMDWECIERPPRGDQGLHGRYSVFANEYYHIARTRHGSEPDGYQLFRNRTAADRKRDELLAAGHVGDRRAAGIRRQLDFSELLAGGLVVDPQMRVAIVQIPDRRVDARQQTGRAQGSHLHDNHHRLGDQCKAARQYAVLSRQVQPCDRGHRDAAADRNPPAMLAGIHVDGDDAGEWRFEQRQATRSLDIGSSPDEIVAALP